MHWFSNQKTSIKIICLVLFMAVFMGLIGFTGYSYNRKSNSNVTLVYSNNLLAVKEINAARSDSNAIQALTLELLLAPLTTVDINREQQIYAQTTFLINDFETLLSQYQTLDLDSFETEKFKRAKDSWQQYKLERQKAVDIMQTGYRQESYAYLYSNAVQHLDSLNTALKELANYKDSRANETSKLNDDQFALTNKVLVFLPTLAVLISIILGMLLARKISEPLSTMVNSVGQLADGNLVLNNVELTSQDELGIFSRSFNQMVHNLRTLITQILIAADRVALSSEELTASTSQYTKATAQVASSISNVALGTDQQFSAVKNTTRAIEKISVNIAQVAHNAEKVVDLADNAAKTTRQGQIAISNTIKQIDKIGHGADKVTLAITNLAQSSHKIGDITDLIADIAGQTNLLALNAAIEAARAGDSGHGFAVVAEEVRKLAEQSGKAAQQINILIENNLANLQIAIGSTQEQAIDVQDSTQVVTTAGEAFTEISSVIVDVSGRVKDISKSIQQMVTSSQQILLSIHEIDSLSRETAGLSQTVSATTEEQFASIQQIEATSHNLAAMALELKQTIHKFKV